jgi:WD40 repeat protein
MGRVFLYNTQPLQYTSQPVFLSELNQLPFQSMEPIIHICHIINHRSIGILSSRYFILWQYKPNENLLIKFCNPYQYDFICCHYNYKYDYIIFGFIDGCILIYQLNQMKQIRRYQYHWKMITDLKSNKNENLFLSSSIDHMINIWNFGSKEIFQK